MNNKLSKKIGMKINSLLAMQNKKQKDLAKHLNVTDNTVSYFCKGSRMPNTEQIIKISQYLNTTTDYLLDIPLNPSIDKDNTYVSQYTGLSPNAIKTIKSISNKFDLYGLEFLLSDDDLLTTLSAYLCSKIYEIFSSSEYNVLPIKEEQQPLFALNATLAPTLTYSKLLEILPLKKEISDNMLVKDKATVDDLLFELAKSSVCTYTLEDLHDRFLSIGQFNPAVMYEKFVNSTYPTIEEDKEYFDKIDNDYMKYKNFILEFFERINNDKNNSNNSNGNDSIE